jgi:hypothetical protein
MRRTPDAAAIGGEGDVFAAGKESDCCILDWSKEFLIGMREEVTEGALYQGIEFEVVLVRVEGRPLVKVRADTHVETALEWHVRRFARFFTEAQILIDSVAKVLFQGLDGGASVADRVSNSEKTAMKHFVFSAVEYRSGISLVFHGLAHWM